MTTAQANINSAAYRLDQNRKLPTCDRCNAQPGTYRLLTLVGTRYESEYVCNDCKGAK